MLEPARFCLDMASLTPEAQETQVRDSDSYLGGDEVPKGDTTEPGAAPTVPTTPEEIATAETLAPSEIGVSETVEAPSLGPALHVSPAKSEAEPSVECQKCGQAVNPKDAQVRGTLTWWCNACNSTIKSLRMKMEWPPRSFDMMSEADKKLFFAEIKQIKNDEGELKYTRLRDVLLRKMRSRKMQEVAKATGGKFLPLSVYEKTLGSRYFNDLLP